MIDNKKRIILIIILLVIIGLTIFIMTVGVNINKSVGIYSLQNLFKAKNNYNKSIDELNTVINSYNQQKVKLTETQNQYNSQKSTYDGIDLNTIKVVQDAQKIEKYAIEYLWIRVGNYAKKNFLDITIQQTGDKADSKTDTQQNQQNLQSVTQPNTTQSKNIQVKDTTTPESTDNSVKMTVTGSYIGLTNFVYDLENDNTLRFKLDNITMIPKGDDKVQVEFTVKNLIVNR